LKKERGLQRLDEQALLQEPAGALERQVGVHCQGLVQEDLRARGPRGVGADGGQSTACPGRSQSSGQGRRDAQGAEGALRGPGARPSQTARASFLQRPKTSGTAPPLRLPPAAASAAAADSSRDDGSVTARRGRARRAQWPLARRRPRPFLTALKPRHGRADRRTRRSQRSVWRAKPQNPKK